MDTSERLVSFSLLDDEEVENGIKWNNKQLQLPPELYSQALPNGADEWAEDLAELIVKRAKDPATQANARALIEEQERARVRYAETISRLQHIISIYQEFLSVFADMHPELEDEIAYWQNNVICTNPYPADERSTLN